MWHDCRTNSAKTRRLTQRSEGENWREKERCASDEFTWQGVYLSDCVDGWKKASHSMVTVKVVKGKGRKNIKNLLNQSHTQLICHMSKSLSNRMK